MSSKIKLTLDFLSYDSAQITNDPADAIKMARSVSESAASKVSRQHPLQVPDATTDLAVALPDATTNYLIMLTDQQVSVKLNGSSTAQVLKPKAAGTKTPVMFIRGDITAMTISNASGFTANIDLIAVKI